MTGRSSRTRPVTRAEVRGFLGKAEEWLETAKEAMQHQRYTAAAGNAICVLLRRQRHDLRRSG